MVFTTWLTLSIKAPKACSLTRRRPISPAWANRLAGVISTKTWRLLPAQSTLALLLAELSRWRNPQPIPILVDGHVYSRSNLAPTGPVSGHGLDESCSSSSPQPPQTVLQLDSGTTPPLVSTAAWSKLPAPIPLAIKPAGGAVVLS